MDRPGFVYVTFIRATPEAVWSALTDEAFSRRYWFGYCARSDWRPGSSFALVGADGSIPNEGEVLEADPPRRLVYTWRTLHDEAMRAEPSSRVTFTLERHGEVVRPQVEHEGFQPGSRVLPSISAGWPAVLSGLKTILETGEALPSLTVCEHA